MKFQKGSKVEVMNKTELPTSWCVAEVVSGNRHTYNLRYDCCYTRIEKVSRELIRPCPPRSNDAHNWVVGDIVEVLDDSSWKTATLVCKVSDGAHFSSRPHGFTYEIVVHKSNIRARQLWQHGKWLPIISGSYGDAKMVEPKFGLQIPMPVEKISEERDSNLLIYNHAGLHESSKTRLKRASPFCSEYYASNKKMNNYSPDSDNCSVGSCSNCGLNKDLYLSNAVDSLRVEEEEGVHGLELHAYRFTLEALYASGPLSWDKEALLTNLRINLHISNDEHLEGLRNLISLGTVD